MRLGWHEEIQTHELKSSVYLVVGTFRLMTIKYFMFLLLNLPKFYFLNIALARLRPGHVGIQCINVGLRDHDDHKG